MRNQFHARNKSGTILKINPKIVDAANAAMKALGTCVILRVGLSRVCVGRDILFPSHSSPNLVAEK